MKGDVLMVDFNYGGTGTLRVRAYAANSALPVANVKITAYNEGDTTAIYTGYTDENGILEGWQFDCPQKALSLDEQNTQKPYGTYNLMAQSSAHATLILRGFQIFDGVTSIAQMALTPTEVDENNEVAPIYNTPEIIEVPSHPLYAGDGGSGPQPIDTCGTPFVLTEVFIPDEITVHLGTPSSSAQNVTVPFIDYVKNVASSEIYPTWPEQSLRANIHAQISVALNRIYTEWYLSKGYNFEITNSTSYDQYFVYGRTIFDSVSAIADDIFNTYVRKTGTVNPYFTEYCDGEQVSCPGMKQWGTVDLANSGYLAPDILKYYYGDDIEIVRTNNIQSIKESYPGTPLTIGSTGTYVKIIQRQLNRIADDYPSFGTLSVDGVYGAGTAEVVRKFQAQFSLSQDGIVGRSTWYKISYIYVSVKDLAELTSEGEKPTGDLVGGTYPGTALSVGSSGDSVYQVQFWLSEIAQVDTAVPTLAVDGQFGSGTKASVEAFQASYGLAVDGVVGQLTWNEIYKQYTSVVTDSTPGITSPGEYPGTALKIGSSGDDVRRMQFYLRIISRYNSSVPDLDSDGIFGMGTQVSVLAFQDYYGLIEDGIVGVMTWNKIYEVYTDLINDLLSPTARPGEYPGTPLSIGSSGVYVKEMQYYLYLLSAYYLALPVIQYDGKFGSATQNAVKVWQGLMGLTQDGVVGPLTWASIYGQFSKLRFVDGTVQAQQVYAYPGYNLSEGTQGDMVKFAQFLLEYISLFFSKVRPIGQIDGVYGSETALSTESFQRIVPLPQTGIIDKDTWDALVVVYLVCAFDYNGVNSVPDGEYGGKVLLLGSTGLQVYRLQKYMDGIATKYCMPEFVQVTGVFDALTQSALESFQLNFGLPVTGFVDRRTWDTIYSYYNS